MVCTSIDEENVFKYLGKTVQELQEEEAVLKIFDMLSGKKDITLASEYLPDNMAEKCSTKDISNSSWKKLKHWTNWWTSTRHLQMFTKAYAIREAESLRIPHQILRIQWNPSTDSLSNRKTIYMLY